MADPRIERLKSVPLFAGCSDKELAFIARNVEEIDVPAGRVLCREGESGGDFFILLSGAVDITRGGARQRTARPGEFFGEIALIDRGPRTATIVTTAPSRLLALSHTQFRDVMHQNPEIPVALLHAVVTRLRKEPALSPND